MSFSSLSDSVRMPFAFRLDGTAVKTPLSGISNDKNINVQLDLLALRTI
jgi:hypothetical protein